MTVLRRFRQAGRVIARVATTVACAAALTLAGCNAPPDTKTSQPAAPPPAGPPGAVVAGRVQLADAPPTGSAGITVYLGGTGYLARTDADGAFRMIGVAKGTYPVVAEKAGWQTLQLDGSLAVDPDKHTSDTPARVKAAVLEKAGGDLDVTTSAAAAAMAAGLKGLGSINGKAFLAGREENQNDGVRVQVAGTQLVTVTDRDGTYRLPNVDPGRYTLSFGRDGFRAANLEVSVDAGKRTLVDDIALEKDSAAAPRAATDFGDAAATEALTRAALKGERSITGIVTVQNAAGEAETDVTFDRVSVALDDSDVVVTPDAQGLFRIGDLPPGLYKVTAALDGGPPAGQVLHQVADLTGEPTVRLQFKFSAGGGDRPGKGTGTVIGHVVTVRESGGVPAASAPAGTDVAGATVGLSGTQAVAVTGPDGRFKLEKVPAATYTFVASKSGFEELSRDGVAVADSATVDLGEIEMTPQRDLPRVVATDPAAGARGVPVAEALVATIRFNKRMNSESVLRAVRVEPDADIKLFFGAGRHPRSADDTLVVMFDNTNDRRPIKFDTAYRIIVLASASDLDAHGMREDFALDFTTGGIGVTRTDPADGASGIIIQSTVNPPQVVFNGDIDDRTLTERNLKVRPDRGTVPTIDIAHDAATGFTAVRMVMDYENDTEYTVTVGRGVRTKRGQALSNTPYTFRFRTGRVVTVPLGGLVR